LTFSSEKEDAKTYYFVTISYTDKGEERGVFFEANKDIFRNLLNTVSYRSKRPIYADEKEREWLITQGVIAHPEPVSVEPAPPSAAPADHAPPDTATPRVP